MGQHFLKDPGTLKKILRLINPQPEDTIIEIGAGKGALTLALIQKAGRVIAIEKEKDFIPYLKKKATQNLHVIEQDILKTSFRNLVEKDEQVKLVGNLPYSISTAILFKVAEEKSLFTECLFLLQKEVAERVCSQPGTKKYAPLSVYLQNFFTRKIHFHVSPESFSPPPKVESSFLSLHRRPDPLFPIHNEGHFLGFLQTAFQHRRKTLWNNLKKIDISQDALGKALKSCGLTYNIRAEHVNLSQFISLYNQLLPEYPRQELGTHFTETQQKK